MDWRRFKTIIIIVMVFINIFLGSYLIRIRLKDNSVSRRMRENVVSVLENNNIRIEEEVFPSNPDNCRACYITRFLGSDTEFIEGIIGGISAQNEGVYTGERGTLTVADEVFDFKINSEEKITLDEESVTAACRKFMEENGIFSDLYGEDGAEISKSGAKARFCLEYDGYKFFDSYIEFALTETGIKEVVGKNIVKAEESVNSYDTGLLAVESIIVTVVRDAAVGDEGDSIEEISFGYYLGSSAGVYSSVLALPVWKIEFASGADLYYDARNGNVINVVEDAAEIFA